MSLKQVLEKMNLLGYQIILKISSQDIDESYIEYIQEALKILRYLGEIILVQKATDTELEDAEFYNNLSDNVINLLNDSFRSIEVYQNDRRKCSDILMSLESGNDINAENAKILVTMIYYMSFTLISVAKQYQNLDYSGKYRTISDHINAIVNDAYEKVKESDAIKHPKTEAK